MGSAIWYKKRNGGTKEREKLREKETTEKEHFADGIKKEKGKSSKEEKEKKSERTKSIARTLASLIFISSFVIYSYIERRNVTYKYIPFKKEKKFIFD